MNISYRILIILFSIVDRCDLAKRATSSNSSSNNNNNMRTPPNTTACDLVGALNSSTIALDPAPLTRVVVTCRTDYNQLCAMIEFRAHMHVHYVAEGNKTKCHSIPVDLTNRKSTIDQAKRFGATSNAMLNFSTDPSDGTQPDTVHVFTTDPACCTKFVRCMSIPLYGNATDDPLFGWQLNFTWIRTPESYEFGEEGWSSVGAPIGSLSGVYDLAIVQLAYVVRPEVGFSVSDSAEVSVVRSEVTDRFQARVGDHYECMSRMDIDMTGENTLTTKPINEHVTAHQFAPNPDWKTGSLVVLSLTEVRSQAFPDINVPEFTGASVVCSNDASHDSTLSIVIGLSICALVLLVMFGLALSHLRSRDREFKIVENID